jgi:hypothetical protein
MTNVAPESSTFEDQRFKTLRHIEAVRNHLNACIKELLTRAEQHDQSKLQGTERETFDEWTPKLRGVTYGSPEYKAAMAQMKPALDHHYAHNRHHPEHHKNGIKDMNLIDLMEMLCDWKSSSMRHNDGNILKSIEINQSRFGYSEDLRLILENTAKWIDAQSVYHKADES